MNLKLNLLGLLLCFGVVAYAAKPINPNAISVGSAINLAAKNRMLTQRVGKAYLMKAINVDVEQAQKEIDKSIVLFDENLRLLSDFAPSRDIRDEIDRVKMQWGIYKNLILEPVSKDNALQIISGNTDMFNFSNGIVFILIKHAMTLPDANKDPLLTNKNLTEKLNIASLCRSLPQRMALYYLAYYGGYTADLKVFKEAFDEYGQNLTTLLTYEGNTQQIEDALSEVYTPWKVLRDDYTDITNKKITPAHIYELTDQLLNAADRVMILYAEQLDLP